jgi:hypothetical protein
MRGAVLLTTVKSITIASVRSGARRSAFRVTATTERTRNTSPIGRVSE